MTALTADRKLPQADIGRFPNRLSFAAEANTMLFSGGMAATNAAGNCVPASAIGALKIHGIVDKQVNNLTTNTPYGAAGAQQVAVIPGCFPMNISTDGGTITAANLKKHVYAVDDNTVSLSDGNGSRPLAGYVAFIDASSNVYIQLGEPSAYDLNTDLVLSSPSFKVKAVQTAALAAYTAAAGVLTANANGAISTADGVTLAAGDVILLPPGIAAAANDAGPYVVTSLGSGGSKFVLTRPDWWQTASTVQAGQIVDVAQGTVYAGTQWKSMAAAAFVVDAAASNMYPGRVTVQVTLVAGTVTIATIPLFSAARSNTEFSRTTANTSSLTTGGYNPSTLTPGVLGTASIVMQAQVAAGTINNADISTGNVTVINW